MPSDSVQGNCEDHHKTKETLIIVIHEQTQGRTLRNNMVQEKNVIKNYGNGKYIGRSEEVDCKEGQWKRTHTVAAIKFDSMEEAERWYVSGRVCKQPDWLGTADVLAVPLTTPYPAGYPVMVIMSVCIKDRDAFFGKFKKSHQESVTQHGGFTRVAGTESVKKLRGNKAMPFCSIDLFPCMESFQKWFASRECDEVAAGRSAIAPGTLIVCQLQDKD